MADFYPENLAQQGREHYDHEKAFNHFQDRQIDTVAELKEQI